MVRSTERTTWFTAAYLMLTATLTAQTQLMSIAPPPGTTFTVPGGVAAVGDVDLDGIPDFAVRTVGAGPTAGAAWFSGYDGHVLRSDLFASPNGVVAGSLVALGDVDGDGVRDVAVTFVGGASTSILVASGATGAPLQSVTAPPNVVVSGCADVTGDGLADFAVATKGSNSGVSYVAPCPPGPDNPNFPWTACTYWNCSPNAGVLTYYAGNSGTVAGTVSGPAGDPFADVMFPIASSCDGTPGDLALASSGGNGSSGTSQNGCPYYLPNIRLYGSPSVSCGPVVGGNTYSTGGLGVPPLIAAGAGGDANQDGAEDVVLLSRSRVPFFIGFYVYGELRRIVYTTGGVVISSAADPAPAFFAAPSRALLGTAFCGRIDADLADDYVVFGDVAMDFYSGATGAALGTIALPAGDVFHSATVIGDLDGDGAKEIAVVRVSGVGQTAQVALISPRTKNAAAMVMIAPPCSSPWNFTLTPGLPRLGQAWDIGLSGGPPGTPALLVACPFTTDPFLVPRAGGAFCTVALDPAQLIVLSTMQLDIAGAGLFQSFLAPIPSVAGSVFLLYGAAVPPNDVVVSDGWAGVFGY